MRVFHVCADDGIAPDAAKGAAVHLRAIARALAWEGHDVRLFSRRDPKGSETPLPAPCAPLRTGEDLLAAARSHGPPDLVYERYALGHVAGLDAARSLGVPFVLEVNAPLVDETKAHRPEKMVEGAEVAEERLFREADGVLVVSSPLRDYVARIRGTDRGIRVVPNGFDPERVTDQPLPEERDGGTLVFLGHPKPWHGASRLPRIVRALRDRGHDVTLLVIGGGPGVPALARSADADGVGEFVQITGEVSARRVGEELARGVVSLAPYPRIEPFYFCPLKVIESMASGLATVTTDQGDLADIVGDAGLIVAPDDETGFFDSVARLLEDRALRSRLGRRGKERAIERFTWRHAARAVTDVLDTRTGNTVGRSA